MGEVTYSSTGVIRGVIEAFLSERAQPKLDKAKTEEEREQIAARYQREVWIADAARRVSQIRAVTHSIKYMHPDARGTNVFDVGSLTSPHLVSSAGENLEKDVVGNAAALDVFKFLKLEVAGISLLQRIQDGDPSVSAAMADNIALAEEWTQSFAGIVEDEGRPASHTLAKQVYFPLEDGDYHLLAPLYPTSLVHRLFQVINHDRFSEEAKSAREARRSQKPGTGYREHLNLAVQSFGGTKPQNISQLNSERGGRAYLLASLPPTWKDQGMKPPLAQRTLFGRWLLSRRDLGASINMLKKFLAGTQHNNLPIREARSRMVNYIVDQVLGLAFTVQSLPAGWSANAECRLNRAECLWLDPGRCDDDPDFAAERQLGDWKENTAAHFGRWLNQLIRSDQAPLDSAAARHWENDFADAMQTFERGMP